MPFVFFTSYKRCNLKKKKNYLFFLTIYFLSKFEMRGKKGEVFQVAVFGNKQVDLTVSNHRTIGPMDCCMHCNM